MTAVLVTSRWTSANAIFTASEVTLAYGIYAGILFGIMGAIAFYIFGAIGRKARMKHIHVHSFIDLLHQNTDIRTRNILFTLVGISYSLDFLLLAFGASIIFFITLHLPLALGILLFILIGIPLLLFRFFRFIGKYAIYKIGIFQSVIIILFVYLFMTSDIERMYFGMRLYHPYMFTLQPKELLFVTISILIIFLGKLLTDLGMWRILFNIKQDKIQQSFILTGSIWATIPLCFSIMIFPALTLGGFQNVTTLYYDLFQLLQSPIFLFISSTVILATLMTTYYSRLNDFLRLFEEKGYTSKKKTINLSIFGIIFVLFVGYLVFQPTITELFFFTGVINSSLFIPMLAIIFIRKIKHPRVLATMSIINIVAGYTSYLFVQEYTSVIISFITSVVIMAIYYLWINKNSFTIQKG